VTRPSRISRGRIVEQLKLAARKGDRGALMFAAEQMKTLAYTPRYWDKYLDLLANPLARLVDLLLIKQGEKIAHQKGWVRPKRAPSSAKAAARGAKAAKPGTRRRAPASPAQPSLFPDLPA
jgi:hypothetical protein